MEPFELGHVQDHGDEKAVPDAGPHVDAPEAVKLSPFRMYFPHLIHQPSKEAKKRLNNCGSTVSSNDAKSPGLYGSRTAMNFQTFVACLKVQLGELQPQVRFGLNPTHFCSLTGLKDDTLCASVRATSATGTDFPCHIYYARFCLAVGRKRFSRLHMLHGGVARAARRVGASGELAWLCCTCCSMWK